MDSVRSRSGRRSLRFLQLVFLVAAFVTTVLLDELVRRPVVAISTEDGVKLLCLKWYVQLCYQSLIAINTYTFVYCR